MVNREKLIEIISHRDIDYDKNIPATYIAHIISTYSQMVDELDFYLEDVTSMAGEGETYTYLDYFDETIKRIVLVKEVPYLLTEFDEINSNEDLADYIIGLYEAVEATKNKILHLNLPQQGA